MVKYNYDAEMQVCNVSNVTEEGMRKIESEAHFRELGRVMLLKL